MDELPVHSRMATGCAIQKLQVDDTIFMVDILPLSPSPEDPKNVTEISGKEATEHSVIGIEEHVPAQKIVIV